MVLLVNIQGDCGLDEKRKGDWGVAQGVLLVHRRLLPSPFLVAPLCPLAPLEMSCTSTCAVASLRVLCAHGV